MIKDLVAAFNAEFSTLWHAERRGVLFPHSLFEDQQHDASLPLQAKKREIWEDALGFCGIEMHRRTLTLAHNADFESIEDEKCKPDTFDNVAETSNEIENTQNLNDHCHPKKQFTN